VTLKDQLTDFWLENPASQLTLVEISIRFKAHENTVLYALRNLLARGRITYRTVGERQKRIYSWVPPT
jgi:hypothetical protein